MKGRDLLAIFNRGLVSRLALARVTDVSRVSMSAEEQTNWMPRTLGSMMLRPGLEYVETLLGNGAILPFIKSNDDTAIMELTASKLRILDNGTALLTRPTVSASITNGEFTTDLADWTDADESGAASVWSAGQMKLTGTQYTSARRRQEVTVDASETATVHALRIVVERGPLLLRVGSTAGADDVFSQAVLRTGTHSIAFVPGATSFWIEFSTSLKVPALVESCAIESAGTVELPTPWTTAALCKLVRWYQSEDVVFCACEGISPRRIERRPNGSWSVVRYEPDDGPYLLENTDSTRLTPSAISGEITVAASRPTFESGHVGAIFKLSSQGQKVESDLSAELTYTNAIRVTGVTSGRIFSVELAGTWSGTLTLQRSIGEPGVWVDVATYSSTGVANYDDGLDNTVAYYRIGFNAGDYTSGTAEASLVYSVGSIDGIVRITGYNSSTSVDAVVLQDLGGVDATEMWSEGSWSDVNGWPTAVAIWEGRVWWGGNGRIYGSASDAFTSFDPEIEGDGGPINRRVGEGIVSQVNWLLPVQRILVGTDGEEHSVRSTSFDEPVTPSNYNTKAPSTKGSIKAPAVSTDARGYFIGRSQTRVYEMQYDLQRYDYTATDATLLVPEIGGAGFIRLGVQRIPDVRLHAIKSTGEVAVLVRDEAEDVMCWVNVETDGVVEDVVVLPGDLEDRVFYRVRRTIEGVNVRYLEKWSREDQARGGTVTRLADSHVRGSGPTSVLTGLDHLEDKSVVVWADGEDKGAFTVSGGQVDVGEQVTDWCAGLGYRARYKSAKLAVTVNGLGPTLLMRTRIDRIGLILADAHSSGLKYGPSFDIMDDMPLMENCTDVTSGEIYSDYDEDLIEFPGDWDTDNRVCLEANAPRPCTVLAVAMSIDRQNAP